MAAKNGEEEKELEAEDAEIEKTNKAKEGKSVVVCPKCMRPVTEGDYIDQLSLMGTTSLEYKINCPQCGYTGLPVEVSVGEYGKWLKTQKKK